MPFILTIAIAATGGAIAVIVNAPIPWLLGSLLLTAISTGVGFRLQQLPVTLEKWMRVIVGVALGLPVAGSLGDLGSATLLAVGASLVSVLILAAVGFVFFQRWLNLSGGEAFLSALPGGLSFMMALADSLRLADSSSRPRVALIHTVRVVSLVLFISLIAILLGTDLQKGDFLGWFDYGQSAPWQWLKLVIVVALSMWLAQTFSIAGGHVTIPLVLSSVVYAFGIVTIPMPQFVITTAMSVFGCILGCEIGYGPRREYTRLAGGSLAFTSVAFAISALFALALSELTGFGFLTLFLALSPGGIAEVSLIALALGLDAGVVAMVHLSRFLLIMLIGPTGLRLVDRKDSE